MLNTVSKTITLNNPSLLFYINSPLYGILFNESIAANYSLGSQEELTIVAKPYFFNIRNDTGSDSDYNWAVNDTPVKTAGPKNQLLLKQTNTNTTGTAKVSLEVKNLVKIFQIADAGFNVNFGK